MRRRTSFSYAFGGVSGVTCGVLWQAVSAANASATQPFTI
jgi:hypothetical protein